MQAHDVAATAGAGVECCCRLMKWHQHQEQQKLMGNAIRWHQHQEHQKMIWNVAAGYYVSATAGAAEDDLECCCRLTMWQQQLEQQKMMWNAAAG